MSKKRTFLRSLMVISFIGFATFASADDTFVSVKPLITDINAGTPGVEVIMPRFTLLDGDNNGVMDSLNIRYDVYQNNSLTKLYSTAPKVGNFPPTPCQDPQWAEAYNEPIFARSGNWVVTGNMMIAECGTQFGDDDAQNAFVYVADASQPGVPGRAWAVGIPGVFLKSIDIADYDGDQQDDLVIMAIMELAGSMKSRIIVKNIQTGATISDIKYPLSTFPVPPPPQ